MLAARQAGREAEETISRFGHHAQIPILPIFDLVPRSPTRYKNKDPFQNSSHNQRMEHEVDAWIAQLTQCKQLSEADVKTLCDRVRFPPHFSERKMVSSPPPFPLCLILFHLPPLGKRNLNGGVKCPARKVSGYSLWRHPWSICVFYPCSTAIL